MVDVLCKLEKQVALRFQPKTQRPALLQLAVARLLGAIDAQEVLRCRDGYRPHGGALEAVETRTIKLQCGRYAWVVEADSTKFFDTIAHA